MRQRIIKTNSTGDTVWSKQYSYDYINDNTVYVLKSLYHSSDSSFYLTGQDSLSNAVLMKLDKDGEFGNNGIHYLTRVLKVNL